MMVLMVLLLLQQVEVQVHTHIILVAAVVTEVHKLVEHSQIYLLEHTVLWLLTVTHVRVSQVMLH